MLLPPNVCDSKTVVKYIGYYLRHPVIATSRIDKYDGDMVTFHYYRHEDDFFGDEDSLVKRFLYSCANYFNKPYGIMFRVHFINFFNHLIKSKLLCISDTDGIMIPVKRSMPARRDTVPRHRILIN